MALKDHRDECVHVLRVQVKKRKKVREVADSGIKADALWATSLMKGKGMTCRV